MLTAASRARFRAGFQHYRARWAYNVVLPRAQEVLGVDRKVHTAEHLASAMFYLGVPRREIPRATLYADPWPRPRPYAVIHPFASAPDKTWPVERFVTVARTLGETCGLDPVIISGPGDDPSAFLREGPRCLCVNGSHSPPSCPDVATSRRGGSRSCERAAL